MTDQFSMFEPAISSDTTSATSSPGSEDGHTLSGSQDGPTSEPCGPDHVPVSRFRALDSEKDMPTNDTSGPLFTHSSPSASLQRSLENRLRARMDVNGSPEYVLTWKTVDMPSGPPICALRASGRRTSDNGCGGWPTPTAVDRPRSQSTMAKSAAFRKRNANQNTVPLYLGEVAQTAGWPTPNAGKSNESPEHWEKRNLEMKAKNPKLGGLHKQLSTVAQIAGWATPTVVDVTGSKYAYASGNHDKPVLKLPGQAALSPAPTTSKGASLNPAFSLWLMGFPTGWARCAALVTRLSRKSRQSS